MVNKQLLNLLKNEDWDEARRVLDCAVRAAASASVSAEGAGSDDVGSASAAAAAAAAAAAEERLREVVEAEDSSGQIPLHIAIWKRAPDDLILSLMDARESTVTARTKNRSTPLHFATFYSSSAAIIEALLRRYPLALDEMNEYQVTPRTYDLGKLDEDARELLMRPTSHWIETFVKDSLEERVKLKRIVRERDGRIVALERRLAEAEAEVEAEASSAVGGRRGDGGGTGAEAGDGGMDEPPTPERSSQKPLDELRASLAEAERENEILRRRCTCECSRGDEETNGGVVDDEDDIIHDDAGRRTSSSTDDVDPDKKSPPPRRAPQFRRRRVLAGATCTTTISSSSSSSPSASSSSDGNANSNATTLERRIEYLEERLSEAIGALDRKISLANNGNGNGNGVGVDAFIDDGGWVITNASAAAAV